jgi:hypothetical protein
MSLLSSPFDSLKILHTHNDWLRAVSLPVSVREVHLEIMRDASEASDLRQATDNIVNKGFFARGDGVMLYSDNEVEQDCASCYIKPSRSEEHRDHTMDPIE